MHKARRQPARTGAGLRSFWAWGFGFADKKPVYLEVGTLFEIGEKIVYGSMGVCEVQDVAPMDFGGGGEKELYYVLRPL